MFQDRIMLFSASVYSAVDVLMFETYAKLCMYSRVQWW